MQRTIFLLLLTGLVLVCFSVSIVHAGGWFKELPGDPVGDDFWKTYNTEPTATPHLGYSTTSSKCRVCHAVHGASDTSYRLLKSGNTTEPRSSGELTPGVDAGGNLGMGNKRSTECMYCHDATSGASDIKPYGVLFGKTVRGEHSLGASWIPDSSVNDTATPGDGRGNLPRKSPGEPNPVLDCYQCHSVHGAKILTFVTGFGWGETQPIDNYILRDDPAGNGYSGGVSPNNDGINSIAAPWSGWESGRSKDTTSYPTKDATAYDPYSIWKYEVQAAWCGDCHNENPNITGPGDFRPNTKSHPLFGGGAPATATETTPPFSGGWMEVYGTTMQVSGGAPKGCEQCHMSGQRIGSQLTMSWPHQAEGVKFLIRSETVTPMSFVPVEEGSKQGPGDSQRAIPNMDKACLWCHQFDAGASGVGLTF